MGYIKAVPAKEIMIARIDPVSQIEAEAIVY